MSTIGERIREKREALGLTQEELARRLRTTRNTVARWERNANAPRGLYAEKVERWLERGK